MNTATNITAGPAPGAGPAADIIAHARAPVTVIDARGRKIGIRKLNAIDRLHLFEALGPKLSENMMYLGYALSAASVTSIDGSVEMPPSSKMQVEVMVGLLEDEGLEAVSSGQRKHFAAGETGDPEVIKK